MSEGKAPIDFNQVLAQLVVNVKAGGDDASLAAGLREQGVPEERIPSLLKMARSRAGVPAPAGGASFAAPPTPAPAPDVVAPPTEAAPAVGPGSAASDEPVKVTFTGPPLSLGAAFVRAAIGGFAAALGGGLIWGMIVAATDYEIGLVAWGIGVVVGIGVLLGTRGAKGLVFQLVAVIASVSGIAIGKYVAFAHIFVKMAREGQIEGVTDASMFGGMTILTFFLGLPQLLGGFDLLWVALAVYTSWKMLSDKVVAAK